MKQYHVYIMSSHSHTLYAGVTIDLQRRVHEHKQKLIAGFTQKCNIIEWDGVSRPSQAEHSDASLGA